MDANIVASWEGHFESLDAPKNTWFRYSVADGSKWPRVHDWSAAKLGMRTDQGHRHWLLIRRHPTSGELAYYLYCAPPEGNAKELARAAGRRSSIEVCFECAKQQTGLDEYEVRSWEGWHRHITLSLLAAVFLAAVRIAATATPTRRSKGRKN